MTFTNGVIHLSDAFPSSVAFDAINSSLESDEAERKDAVKKGNAVFAFTLKNKEGQTESWYIDLKEKGEVAKGGAPAGKKADGKSILSSRGSECGYGSSQKTFLISVWSYPYNDLLPER